MHRVKVTSCSCSTVEAALLDVTQRSRKCCPPNPHALLIALLARAYLLEVSPVPMFELEQVEEDGERRLAQLDVRNESHLEERPDYAWKTEGIW